MNKKWLRLTVTELPPLQVLSNWESSYGNIASEIEYISIMKSTDIQDNALKSNKHSNCDNSNQLTEIKHTAAISQFNSYSTPPPGAWRHKNPTPPVLGLVEEKSKARLGILVPEVKCQ